LSLFSAPQKSEEPEMPRLTNEEKAAIKEQFKQQKLAEKMALKEEIKKKRQEEMQKKKEEKALVNYFTNLYRTCICHACIHFTALVNLDIPTYM
jgi:hypothetical protein